MKRIISISLVFALLMSMTACTTEKDLYGVWYCDSLGKRNAIQLSENDDGKDVFAWAVYDLEAEAVIENSTGYYYVTGDTITFEYSNDTAPFELNFTFENNKLKLYSDTASLVLEKFVLEEST